MHFEKKYSPMKNMIEIIITCSLYPSFEKKERLRLPFLLQEKKKLKIF